MACCIAHAFLVERDVFTAFSNVFISHAENYDPSLFVVLLGKVFSCRFV